MIDLRSPAEHAEDRLPGAVNVPLFDDVERALVGTLYRRQSPEAAFDAGRRIVRGGARALAERIAEHVGWELDLAELDANVAALVDGGYAHLAERLACRPAASVRDDAVVLHCWRGGLRSQSVAALVRALGLDRAVVLAGGYRAWRGEVVRTLDELRLPPVVALRGLTGVGKTLVLREIERARPGWTIDLEELAQHRSSILGMVGLEPVSQKRFESRFLERVERGLAHVAVVEGESRKVGDVIVPRRMWSALEDATHVELTAPVERRVQVLIEDYLVRPDDRAELAKQLAFLDERMDLDGESLRALFAAGDEERVVRILLERWYDPRYRHGEQGRRYGARFDASDPSRCAREIVSWIEARELASVPGSRGGAAA